MGVYVNRQFLALIKEGRALEDKRKFEGAGKKFELAWSLSNTDFEKYVGARLMAKTHEGLSDQLEWLFLSLDFGMKADNNSVKISLPSLYYEIGVCYEDLSDYLNAKANYRLAQNYIDFMPKGREKKLTIKALQEGLERIDNRRF